MTHGNENLESLMSQAGRGESIALTAHGQRLKPADRDLNLRRLSQVHVEGERRKPWQCALSRRRSPP